MATALRTTVHNSAQQWQLHGPGEIQWRRWLRYAALLTPVILFAGQLPDTWLINLYGVPFAKWYQPVLYPFVGDKAYTADWYGWLGFGLHFAIALGWGFTYLTAAVFLIPKLARSVLPGAALLGVATWLVMQGAINLPFIAKHVTGVVIANTMIGELLWAIPVALGVYGVAQLERHRRWPFAHVATDTPPIAITESPTAPQGTVRHTVSVG